MINTITSSQGRPVENAFYRITILIIVACIIGGIVSLAAIAFLEAVAFLNTLLFVSPHTRIQIQDSLLLGIVTVAVPTLGGLLVGFLFQKLSPTHGSLGPIDSIYAVQLRQELPDWRSGMVSTIAAVLSLGCGASVGQYGPMVYMGSLFGGLVAKLKLHIPNLTSIAIACGVATAISTAFSAPIAGIIFAHEVILRHYSLQSFAPTTVSAAAGYIVANVVFERDALFLVQFDTVTHSYEYALFAFLGLASALLATVFMHLILKFSSISQNLKLASMWHPALAGLLVGFVALALPEVLGTGRETLRFAIVEGAFETQELLLLVGAKLVLTAVCVSFGFAGGVFSPALLIGILFGALAWSILELMGIPNSGVVVYAICGMMAVNTAVIGAPLTTILIVYELTRNYDLTIAAMVSVVFANLLAFRIFGRSLFDIQLAKKGIDLSLGRDRVILENTPVTNFLSHDYIYLLSTTRVEPAIAKLKTAENQVIVLIDEESRYVGMLNTQALLHSENDDFVQALSEMKPEMVETTSIWQAMRCLDQFSKDGAPVLTEDRKVIGILTETNLINAYMDIMHGIRKEENAVV
jgi:CIC family chloride channel protein